ncbi:MAG: hypothetical protein WC926_01800 [Candidatus Paceibacterota bacterium]|jgi:hypothetical protein
MRLLDKIKKASKIKILVPFLLVLILLSGIFLVIWPGSGPKMTGQSLFPQKVRPGDTLVLNLEAGSVFGVKEISADLGGLETIKFKLVSGNIFRGSWRADWKVSEKIELKKYQVRLIAKDNIGKESEDVSLWFEDPLFGPDFSTSAISGGFTVNKDASSYAYCYNSPSVYQGTKVAWNDGGGDVFDRFGCPMVQIGGTWQALPMYNTAAGVWTTDSFSVGGTDINVKQGWANTNVYIIKVSRTGGTEQNANVRISGNMGSDSATNSWTDVFSDSGIAWKYYQGQDSSTRDATGGDPNFFMSVFSTDPSYSESAVYSRSVDNVEAILNGVPLPVTFYVSWGQMARSPYTDWVASDWSMLNQAPNSPVLVSPLAGYVGASLAPSLVFNYSDPEGDACTKFDLKLDDNFDFSSPIIDLSDVSGSWTSGSDITYSVGSDLVQGMTYYWKARVFDGTAWSPWAGGPSWYFISRTDPRTFTIKRDNGYPCLTAEECYYGVCTGGFCGGSATGPALTNLTSPSDTSENCCKFWLDASDQDKKKSGLGGQFAFSWVYQDPIGSPMVSYELKVSEENNINGATTTYQNRTGLNASSGSQIDTVPTEVRSGDFPGYMSYGKTYYWWAKACNADAACTDWTAGPSFSTPAKHYPIVGISWANERIVANQNIQFCTTADVNNPNDPCYAACYKGSASPAEPNDPTEADTEWICSVCYAEKDPAHPELFGKDLSCQDVAGTQYSWIFPDLTEGDEYTFVSSTSAASANPIVKFTTVKKDQMIKLRVSGSTCGEEIDSNILLPNPVWKETNPF